jgi:GNAT superfamily N-acetyltransferase
VDTPFPAAPAVPASILHLPHPMCYKRIRSIAEVERALDRLAPIGIGVSIKIFTSWANPANGMIPMPDSSELPINDTHHVSLIKYDSKHKLFTFHNSWRNWGDRGNGYIPYEYFNRYMFECWAVLMQSIPETRHEVLVDGTREIRWVIRDEWDRRIYGYEINNKETSERWAWAFVLERDGALEIEDFYVRPEFRRRGYGSRLSEKILGLAKAKQKPLRLWVSFADSQQESPGNYPALVALTSRLGIQYQPCPVRWAAYYATNEIPGASLPIEPPRIPVRPRCSRKDIIAAALAAGIQLGGAFAFRETRAIDDVAFSVPHVTLEQNAPKIEGLRVGTADWDKMNVRRMELIQKKNRNELDAEEHSELERLQQVSLETVERSIEKPAIDWELLEHLEEKLLHKIADRSGADELQP